MKKANFKPALTKDEKKLVDFARKKILEYSKMRKAKGLYDSLYAFVLSDGGNIYVGKPLESNLSPANHCAEAQAISVMLLEETEKAKIKSILIFFYIPYLIFQ